MARRLIAAKTFEDEWFGCLDDRTALVWFGLITTIADDQGRFPAISALIRSRLFAYRDVPISDVEGALEAFTAAGKLHRYEADGKTLLQIVNWWKHQRPTWAQPSEYPAPKGWTDRARHRENGKYVVSENWEHGPAGFVDEADLLHDPSRESSRERSREASPSHENPYPYPNPTEKPPSSADADSEEVESLEVVIHEGALAACDEAQETFDAFWTHYPRPEDKKRTRAAWGRMNDEERRLCTGVAEIMERLVATGARERRFVPLPSTFLRGRRWEDWRDGVPAGWQAPGADRAAAQEANLAAAVAAAHAEETLS